MTKNLLQLTLMLVLCTFLSSSLFAQDELIELDAHVTSHAIWHFANPSVDIHDERADDVWYPDRAVLEAVDSSSYSGIYSIAVKGSELGSQTNFRFSYDNPYRHGLLPEHEISFRVFIPEDEIEKIDQIVFYDMHDTGDGFDYSQTAYNAPGGDVTADEWITLTHAIDRDVDPETMARIGFRVNMEDGYSDDPPLVLVDFFSTDPDAPLHPHLSVPQNVSTSNITSSGADLSWDAPYGDDEVEEYVVYRGGNEIARTQAAEFTDSGLRPETDYQYRIAAMSTDSLLTEATAPQHVQTESEEFETHATWHFMTSGEWSNERDDNVWYTERSVVEAIDSEAYSGIYSMALKGDHEQLSSDATDFRFSFDNPSEHGVQPRQDVHVRIFVAEEEMEKVDRVSFYLMDEGWNYNGTTFGELTAGEWNTVTHYVDRDPLNTIFNRMGVRVDVEDGYYDDPPEILVDFITTDPDAPLHPHLSVPQNVSASNITSSGADLSWDAPYGDDEVEEYVVYRGGFDDLRIEDFDEIARTQDTEFTDIGLRHGTNYHYRIAAMSTDSLITDPTGITWIQTEEVEFETHATWHFMTSGEWSNERDDNVWYTERSVVEAIDSEAYSGIYSMALKGDPEQLSSDATDFRFSFDDPSEHGVQPRHEVHVRIYVEEEEMEKVDRVSFYLMDEGWNYGATTFHELTAGEWNTAIHYVDRDPLNTIFNRMGVRVDVEDGYYDDPPEILVDFITTDPNAPLHPHLSVPQNVSASNITSSGVELSWDAPYGDDEVEEYVVYRGGFDDLRIEDFDEIARTSSTNYTDEDLQESTDYHYRLAAVSTDGLLTVPTDITWVQTVTSTLEEDAPLTFELRENYPNPFNPSTNIRYQIAEPSTVTLEVYNVMGQRVRTLVNNQEQQAGQYHIEFNADNLASGMYIYRIEAGDFRQTRQMMLIK